MERREEVGGSLTSASVSARATTAPAPSIDGGRLRVLRLLRATGAHVADSQSFGAIVGGVERKTPLSASSATKEQCASAATAVAGSIAPGQSRLEAI